MYNNNGKWTIVIAAYFILSWILYKGCIAIQIQETVLCNGITDDIICPQYVIRIKYASYGRHDNRTCPGPEMKNTNCFASNSFSYISGKCDGHPTCDLDARKENFGDDPCFGTAKYLIVENNCKQNGVIKSFHSSVICENTYGSIICNAGVIQVTFANFGRLDDYNCPYWKQTATNCHANDSFSLVSAMCEGKTQCTLTASASSFSSDNCDYHIHRYLTVHYTCGGVCPDDMNAINSTGALIYKNGTNENDILKYECQHGVRSGNLQRTCQVDGTWSGKEPNCEVFCPNDTNIINSTGALTKISGYNENETLTYECQHGVISGDLERSCQRDGSWSGTEPECEVVCPNDTNIINSTGALTKISGYNENETLTYECQHGVISGDLERSCQRDGSWSGTEPECVIVCTNDSSIINFTGALTDISGYNENDKLTYECHYGVISGDLERLCLKNGSWSGSEPQCEVVCPNDTNIINSTGALAKISGYNENETITYECQHGVISGDLERSCQSDGSWSGTEPECVVVCTNDSSIINFTGALTDISGYNENDKLTYECHFGVISGDLERLCLKNGSWSGSEPQCEVICSNHTNEINSSGTLITVSGYSYSQHDVLTYRCHNDIVTGNSQRFCLSDGSWSGSEPACSCMCPCEATTNESVSDFEANFETLIIKLKVNKKETSKFKRSLISAKDDRPSSQSMGGAAIVVIVLVLLTLIIPDFTRVYVFCQSIRKKY